MVQLPKHAQVCADPEELRGLQGDREREDILVEEAVGLGEKIYEGANPF
jgi:hypothetical protein